MPRRLPLVLATALAALAGVLPARAAPDVTITGVAGSWAHVTLPRETTFHDYDGPVVVARASTGPFAGISLDDRKHWATYVVGNTDRPCAYAPPPARCPVGHLAYAGGYGRVPRTLAPGRYRLALLGAPGSRVTVRVRGGTFTGPVRWSGRGSVAVKSVYGTGPADHEVVADELFSFPQRGTTVLGAVGRIDMDGPSDTRTGFCARSRWEAPSLPGDVVCSGDDLVSRVTLWSRPKGYCAECFPWGAPMALTGSLAGVFWGPKPDLRAHLRATAKSSRITVTAFALTLP